MADQQVGNKEGVAACHTGATGIKTNLTGDNTSSRHALDMDNTDSIAAMRARLQTINATTYSDAELDKMTYNDMVYAIRVNDFPTSIKQ